MRLIGGMELFLKQYVMIICNEFRMETIFECKRMQAAANLKYFTALETVAGYSEEKLYHSSKTVQC